LFVGDVPVSVPTLPGRSLSTSTVNGADGEESWPPADDRTVYVYDPVPRPLSVNVVPRTVAMEFDPRKTT
jgi:hypothetical protein